MKLAYQVSNTIIVKFQNFRIENPVSFQKKRNTRRDFLLGSKNKTASEFSEVTLDAKTWWENALKVLVAIHFLPRVLYLAKSSIE